jgi:hypothetical protein
MIIIRYDSQIIKKIECIYFQLIMHLVRFQRIEQPNIKYNIMFDCAKLSF